MVKVSASMLKAYNTCPMKVCHRRRKTPTVKSASMLVGSLIHDMIADYEINGDVDFAEYSARMVRELSSGDEITFRRWQTIPALTKLVNTCYNNYLVLREEFPPLLSVEETFTFEYDHDAEAVGRFDQLRADDMIVELKTSHYPPTEEFLAADLQATFYIWAYRELFHTTPVYYYVHLPTGSIYEIYRRDLDVLYSNIHEYTLTCRSRFFLQARDGYKCSKCEYRAACLTETEGCRLIKQVATKPRKKEKSKDSFF